MAEIRSVRKCERCGDHFEDAETAYEIHMLRHTLEDIHKNDKQQRRGSKT